MKKYKLIKISSSHKNLRTDEFVGFSASPVCVGNIFRIFNNEPLDEKASYRVITTTPVATITKKENKTFFTTRNSEYSLEELGENSS